MGRAVKDICQGSESWTLVTRGLQIEATPSAKALGGNHLDPFGSQRIARKLGWLREGVVKGESERRQSQKDHQGSAKPYWYC